MSNKASPPASATPESWTPQPVLIFTHMVCLEHDTGPHHPESASRLRAIFARLQSPEFEGILDWREAPHASLDQIQRAHPMHHIEEVLSKIPHGDGQHHLDDDTVISSHSGEAALRAAGAGIAAVDAVMAGPSRRAFCPIRPPGHHAERDLSMGFCLFNNCAIAALHAHHAHGLERVAVIDFDAHHGNGIQHILEDQPGFFYASTHELGAFPNTGHERDHGPHDTILNAPLPTGSTIKQFRSAFNRLILPALRAFRPQILILSAGFDAHLDDPMAYLELTAADFAWITEVLCKLADEMCEGRVVSMLEGGYDLNALAASTAAHLRTLWGGA